jgi:hypothetical protein
LNHLGFKEGNPMSTIGSVNSNATLNGASHSRTSSGLTADQKSSIKSVLSQFDATKLSASDAKKITTEFKKSGVQPGKELEEAMASSGFDAKQVGDLAFGQGQQSKGGVSGGNSQAMVSSALSELKSLVSSISGGTSSAGKSEEEISQATDSFLKTVFSQSSESRTANTTNRSPQGGPPPGGPQGGNPPPPPPAENGSYKDATEVETYLSSLIASISSGADNTTSDVSKTSGFDQIVKSASSLLNATGIEASSENLQSFMQILQKNIAALVEDKGNVVDRSV